MNWRIDLTNIVCPHLFVQLISGTRGVLSQCVLSLGDADTLIAHGTTMTHDDCNEELLKTIGITPDLIRMSIGIENKEDIIADLAQALDKVTVE